MPATTTPETALRLIALELILIARESWEGDDAWAESEEGILSHPKVRQLGEQANRLGGMTGMQDAARLACLDSRGQVRDSLSRAMLSELNYAWNGIGTWLA